MFNSGVVQSQRRIIHENRRHRTRGKIREDLRNKSRIAHDPCRYIDERYRSVLEGIQTTPRGQRDRDVADEERRKSRGPRFPRSGEEGEFDRGYLDKWRSKERILQQ